METRQIQHDKHSPRFDSSSFDDRAEPIQIDTGLNLFNKKIKISLERYIDRQFLIEKKEMSRPDLELVI